MKKYVREDTESTTVCTVRNTHSQTGGGKQRQNSPTLLKFMNTSTSKENFPVGKVASCRTSPIDTAYTAKSRSQVPPALGTLAVEKEGTLKPRQSWSILSHHSKPPQDGIPKPNLEQEDKNLGKGSRSSTSRQPADKSHDKVAQSALVASAIPANLCPTVHCRSSAHSKQTVCIPPPQSTDLQGEVHRAGDYTCVTVPDDATPERSRTPIFRVAGQKRKLLPDVGETGKAADWPPKKKRKKQNQSEFQKENSQKSPGNTKSPSSEVCSDKFPAC